MGSQAKVLMCITVLSLSGRAWGQAEGVPQFRNLFNGTDLSGWVNVNTAEDTWTVRDATLVCKGHPIGVLRTERQYENFILQVDWKHLEAGGNSAEEAKDQTSK